jgi:hypothetical protein
MFVFNLISESNAELAAVPAQPIRAIAGSKARTF